MTATRKASESPTLSNVSRGHSVVEEMTKGLREKFSEVQDLYIEDSFEKVMTGRSTGKRVVSGLFGANRHIEYDTPIENYQPILFVTVTLSGKRAMKFEAHPTDYGNKVVSEIIYATSERKSVDIERDELKFFRFICDKVTEALLNDNGSREVPGTAAKPSNPGENRK